MDATRTEALSLILPCGRVVLFDAADSELLAGHHWHSFKNPHHKTWYAGARVNGRRIRMHRLITAAPKGMLVDHKDGNGLNNCRSNLRVCTQFQNASNVPKTRGKHPYKGVAKGNWNGRSWYALIKVRGKTHYLGSFATVEEAARAYDQAAIHHFGEYAYTNFPEVPA